jgi:hypothetical protein
VQIEPYILVPVAAVFVLLVILIIRLLAGPKNVILSKDKCRQYLEYELPDLHDFEVQLSDTQKLALIYVNKTPTHIIRSFGDKLVLQHLDAADVRTTGEADKILDIRRQDIAHSSVKFRFPSKVSR